MIKAKSFEDLEKAAKSVSDFAANSDYAADVNVSRQKAVNSRIDDSTKFQDLAIASKSMANFAANNPVDKNYVADLNTARQKLLSVQEPEQKWYKGTAPTVSEQMARIYTIGKTDPAKSEVLFNNFMALQQDPSSPIYNPYTASTNPAMTELAKYGLDVTGWQKSDMENALRQYSANGMFTISDTSGNPNKPSTKASAQEWQAYWLYQVYKDEDKTVQAETEWQALQDEIKHWTNDAHNYSDEEILGKIDWSNYKTLVGMDEGKNTGMPTPLNRGIGYSQDALQGVIWAARNNGGTGNSLLDSASAVLGNGNAYKRDDALYAKRDANNEGYSPYSFGSTMDDACLYFGTYDFGADWLEQNKGILNGNDETAKKMYMKVYNAEQTTLKAEAEKKALWDYIDKQIANGVTDANKLIGSIDRAFFGNDPIYESGTLAKLDESMKTPNLTALTRAVGYSRYDMEQYIRQQMGVEADKRENEETANDVAGSIGGAAGNADPQALKDEKNARQDNINDVMLPVLTGDEPIEWVERENKGAFGVNNKVRGTSAKGGASDVTYTSGEMGAIKYAGTNTEAGADAITDGILNGNATPEDNYLSRMGAANKLAAQNYFDARTAVEKYKKMQATFDAATANLVEMDKVVKPFLEKYGLASLDELQNGIGFAGDLAQLEEDAKYYYENIGDLEDYQKETLEPRVKEYEKYTSLDGDIAALCQNFATTNQMTGVTTVPTIEKIAELHHNYEANIASYQHDMDEMQAEYEKGQQLMADIDAAYTDADNVRSKYGIEVPEGEADDQRGWLDIAYQLGSEYVAPQYLPNSYGDMLMRPDTTGKAMTQEEVIKAFEGGQIQEVSKEITAVKDLLDRLESNNVVLPQDAVDNIKQYQANLESVLFDMQCFCDRGNADFEQVVSAAKEKYGASAPGMFASEAEKHAYYAVHPEASINLGGTNEGLQHGGFFYEMTQEERDTYLYYAEKYNSTMAEEYYGKMSDYTFKRRASERATETTENIASGSNIGAVAATAMSIVAAPMRLAGTVYALTQLVKGEDINPYEGAFGANNIVNTMRAASKDKLVRGTRDEAGNDTAWTKILGYGYDVIVSTLESAWTGTTIGGTLNLGEGATGLLGFTEKAIGGTINAMPMALGAVGDTFYEGALNGEDPAVTAKRAVVTFLSESMSEGFELEAMRDAFAAGEAGVGGWLNNVISSYFNEAFGEGVGQFFEIRFDPLYEKNHQDALNYYTQELKMGPDEAEMAWAKHCLDDVLEAGIVGGFSGALGSAGGYVVGKAVDAINYGGARNEFATEHNVNRKDLPKLFQQRYDTLVENGADTTALEEQAAKLGYSLTLNDNARKAASQQEQPVEETAQEVVAEPVEAEPKTAPKLTYKERLQKQYDEIAATGLFEQETNDLNKRLEKAQAKVDRRRTIATTAQQKTQAALAKLQPLAWAMEDGSANPMAKDAYNEALFEYQGAQAEQAEAEASLTRAENQLAAVNKTRDRRLAEIEDLYRGEAQRIVDEENRTTQDNYRKVKQEYDAAGELLAEAQAAEAAAQEQQNATPTPENALALEKAQTDVAEAQEIYAEAEAAMREAEDALIPEGPELQLDEQTGEINPNAEEENAAREARRQMVIDQITDGLMSAGDAISAIAGIVNSIGEHITGDTTGVAVATKLVDAIGAKDAGKLLNMLFWNGVNENDVITAITAYAFSDKAKSDFLKTLNSIGNTMVGSGNVGMTQQFVEAAAAAVQDADTANEIAAGAQTAKVDHAVAELIAQGRDNELTGAQKNAFDNASTQLSKAKTALKEQQDALAELKKVADDALQQFVADPVANKGIYDKAVADVQHQALNVKNYEQALENRKNEYENAKKAYKEAKAKAVQQIRAEAQQMVGEQDAAVAQQQQANAQARAEVQANAVQNQRAAAQERLAQKKAENQQRQENNASASEVDEFLKDSGLNLSEQDKAHVAEKYNQIMKEGGKVKNTKSAVLRLANSLGKKYGFKVEFADLASNNPGHFNKSTNTLVLSKNATQGEVLRQTFLHELTHMAEKSDLYGDLMDSMLTLKYGDDYANSDQYKADFGSMRELYAKNGENLTDTEVNEELTAEAAWDILFPSLEDAQKLTEKNPGLVRRILNWIEDMLNRVRGINDPEVERLKQARELYRKCLETAEQNNGNVIPLSQRFSSKNDPRYRYTDQNTLPSDEVLGRMLREWMADREGNEVQADAKTTPAMQAMAATTRATNASRAKRGRKPANIKSGDTIIREWSKAIGIPVDYRMKYYRHDSRSTTLGYTVRSTGTTHVVDAGAVDVAAHEIGHVLDRDFGLQAAFGPAGMASIKTAVEAIDGTAWERAYRPDQIDAELVAHFMTHYMEYLSDPSAAISAVGATVLQQMDDFLFDNGLMKATRQAAIDLKLNQEATDTERMKAAIEHQERKAEGEGSWFERMERKLFDHANYLRGAGNALDAAGETAENNVRHMQKGMVNATRNFIEGVLNDGLVDMQGNVMVDEKGNAYGSLKDIFQQVNEKDQADLEALWLALHAKSRNAVGKRVNSTETNEDAVIADLEARRPDLKDVIDQAEAWYTAFMQEYMVNTGLMTQETFDNMRKMYPYYVPTYRADYHVQDNSVSGGRKNGGRVMMRAKGETSNIFNPTISLIGNVEQIITKAKHNEVLQAFDYDVQNTDNFYHVVEERNVQKAADRDVDLTNIDAAGQGLIDIGLRLGSGDNISGEDVITVYRKNGDVVKYVSYSPALTMALSNDSPKVASGILRASRRFLNFLAGNATARNFGFTVQNVPSDAHTAMTTGKAGRNPLTFGYQFINSLVDYAVQSGKDKAGKNVSETYRQYKLFGQLGSRYIIRGNKSIKKTTQEMYQHDKTVKDYVKKIVTAPVWTLEALSEFGENLTRYTSFKYSGQDLNTYNGRILAGENAREASTDFTAFGSSEELPVMKNIVPFLNGTLQGIHKTLTMFTSENEGNRVKTAASLLVSSALPAMILAAVRGITWDDDEKEAYEQMTEYERNKYWHIKVGDGEFIKIKKSQDAVIQAVCDAGEFLGWVVGNNMDGYADMDEQAMLLSSLEEAASNLLPDLTQTAFNPIINAVQGKTWYGSDIETGKLANLPVTARRNADTPIVYSTASQMLNALGVEMSPVKIEYAVNQYIGSYGTIGITAVSNLLGGNEVLKAAWDSLTEYTTKSFTVDANYSNACSATYYNMKTLLQQVGTEAKNGSTITYFRPDLTREEVDAGVAEAAELLAKGGAISNIDREIAELWGKHDDLSEDNTMSAAERLEKQRDVRAQINQKMLEANGIIGDYWAKYSYESDLIRNMANVLYGGEKQEATPTVGYDSIPDIFKQDEGEEYMGMMREVYDKTGLDSDLPHPLKTFSSDKVEYTVPKELLPEYNEVYRDTYRDVLESYDILWGDMTDEEKNKAVDKAHTKANNAAKKWYLNNYGY